MNLLICPVRDCGAAPGAAGARPGLPARALVRPRARRLRQPAPAPGPAIEGAGRSAAGGGGPAASPRRRVWRGAAAGGPGGGPIARPRRRRYGPRRRLRRGVLPRLARPRAGFEAHGVDLSSAAIALAARRYPEGTWVVANADRSLPWVTNAFDLVLSIDARLNPAEMRRVLKPGGRLLVAVPAADDLVELRAAVLGEGVLRDRLEGAAGRLAADFELEGRRTVRDRARLGPDELRDALAATYRLRESRRQADRRDGRHPQPRSRARFKGKIAAAAWPLPTLLLTGTRRSRPPCPRRSRSAARTGRRRSSPSTAPPPSSRRAWRACCAIRTSAAIASSW